MNKVLLLLLLLLLYRLSEVNKTLSELETIRDEGEKLVKKYKKYRSTIHAVDVTTCALAVGRTAAGVACISSVIALPIGVGVQCTSLALGLISVLSKYVWKRLGLKVP